MHVSKLCRKIVPEFLEFEDSDSISYKQWLTKTETRIMKNKEKIIKRTVKEEIVCKKNKLISGTARARDNLY